MLSMKERSTYGVNRAIVKSHNVDLKSEAFIEFSKRRREYELFDHYESPGPIQHFGKMKSCVPLTLSLENTYDMAVIDTIQKKLNDLKDRCRFGGNLREMEIIKSHLDNLTNTLALLKKV